MDVTCFLSNGICSVASSQLLIGLFRPVPQMPNDPLRLRAASYRKPRHALRLIPLEWSGMRFSVALLSVTIACSAAHAQWQMQDSNTTASLRAIDSVDGTIAWASGTG